jgi:superfamily I DNA/RNA helicase
MIPGLGPKRAQPIARALIKSLDAKQFQGRSDYRELCFMTDGIASLAKEESFEKQVAVAGIIYHRFQKKSYRKPDFKLFLSWLLKCGSVDQALLRWKDFEYHYVKDNPKAVLLSTIHSAKGGEWRDVIVMGVEHQTFSMKGCLPKGKRRHVELSCLNVAWTRATRSTVATFQESAAITKAMTGEHTDDSQKPRALSTLLKPLVKRGVARFKVLIVKTS